MHYLSIFLTIYFGVNYLKAIAFSELKFPHPPDNLKQIRFFFFAVTRPEMITTLEKGKKKRKCQTETRIAYTQSNIAVIQNAKCMLVLITMSPF